MENRLKRAMLEILFSGVVIFATHSAVKYAKAYTHYQNKIDTFDFKKLSKQMLLLNYYVDNMKY